MRKRSQPDSIDSASTTRHSKRVKPNGQPGNFNCPFGAKYSPAWKSILPLLPLVDWMSLAKVDPLLGRFIADHLSEITIDDEFVDIHPVPEYPDFYKTLGSLTKKLIVSSVPRGEDTSAILSYFNNVQSITVIDSMRPIAKCNYPGSLNSLTLIHCTIPCQTMASWLKTVSSTLQSLHFDRCTFTDRPYEIEMVELPKLRHVVMIGEDVVKDFWNFTETTPIETLVLQLGESPTPEMFLFPSLKSLEIRVESLLHYDYDTRDVKFTLEHYSLKVTKWKEELFSVINRATEDFLSSSKRTLRSLCLPGCPVDTAWLNEFPNLKELTIHAPLETKEEQDKMMALHLQCPKININYNLDPNPTFDEILRLDEDCLAAIFCFLQQKDLLQLLRVHWRFKKPVLRCARRIWTKYVEHPTIGYCGPKDPHTIIYKAIGGDAEHLNIEVDYEPEFWRILDYFPNISALTVRNELNNKKDILKKFPRLTELTLKKKISVPLFKELLKPLSGSLTNLSCQQKSLNPLKVLTNLQTLCVSISAVANHLSLVLSNNPKCTDLTVDFDSWPEVWRKEWTILSQLKQVKRLHLNQYSKPRKAVDDQDIVFEHVEEFRMSLTGYGYNKNHMPYHMSCIFARLGPQLKLLTIMETNGIYPSISIDLQDLLYHLPNLEELHMNFLCAEFDYIEQEGYYSSILKKLTMAVASRSSIINLIRALPKMEVFKNVEMYQFQPEWVSKREIEAALGKDRTLEYEGGKSLKRNRDQLKSEISLFYYL